MSNFGHFQTFSDITSDREAWKCTNGTVTGLSSNGGRASERVNNGQKQ